MNTWKAILAAVVIFSAGLVTGAVWIKASGKNPPAQPLAAPARQVTRPQSSLPLEHLRKVELMGRVQKDLELTPAQREQIEKVIADGQNRIRDLWDQVAPEIHDELRDVREKLCSQLTEDQKSRFDELMKHGRRAPATNATPKAPAP